MGISYGLQMDPSIGGSSFYPPNAYAYPYFYSYFFSYFYSLFECIFVDLSFVGVTIGLTALTRWASEMKMPSSSK